MQTSQTFFARHEFQVKTRDAAIKASSRVSDYLQLLLPTSARIRLND